jgi:hypothetical protein
MSRVVAVASAASDVAVTTGSVPSVPIILSLGGIVLAVVAFGVVSTLAKMLGAAVAAVSEIFAVLGRWISVAVIGSLIAGFALFSGFGAASEEAPAPQPAPSAAATRR